MVNYSASIIYKIVCKDVAITNLYIGSTTNYNRRRTQHKSVCNNINDTSYNLNVYQFIRETGGWQNWDMVQVEAYQALNKRTLETRERYWIEELKADLNKIIPTRTVSEYYQSNKVKIDDYRKDYYKIYYQSNKVKIDDYRKDYYKIYYKSNKTEINKRQNYLYHLKFYNKLQDFILS